MLEGKQYGVELGVHRGELSWKILSRWPSASFYVLVDTWYNFEQHMSKRQAEGADGGGGEGSADGEGDSGDDVTEEFFCDACDKTVPLRALSGPADGHSGLCTRYECAICPDEFLLCGKCYVTLKACDRGHALYRSTARKHITRILDEEARARDAE